MQSDKSTSSNMPELLARVWSEWGEQGDLWVFAYASLIWRPEQPVAETRLARIHGYHRALQMWSRVNRGTPACPGLVFTLIAGGCCRGMVQRIAHADVADYLPRLWDREMPTAVYTPRWLEAQTDQGPVKALAFTLAKSHPSYTGVLSPEQYRHIFQHAIGRYGSTLDYAKDTYQHLLKLDIDDRALARLLHYSEAAPPISSLYSKS
jgi:cation transport protein ChaC